MADYVLDTHACLFALAAPRRLGRRARRVLTSSAGHCFWLPAATVTKVALLRALERVELGLPELRAAFETARLRFLELTWDQLDESSGWRSAPCTDRRRSRAAGGPSPAAG